MANPRFDVEIGANVDGLTAGVNTATGQLDKLGKAAKSTAPQVDKLKQATAGYNSVGIDFARIVQDAPFGIIGVGNNIQQLAGSFQSLKNSTGSTKDALKAAFSSIFSSGNALVLGISALTSVFTILQMKGFFKTEDAAKSLSETLEDYRATLDAVTRTSIEGQANAAKEIQSFTLLRAQAENTALSQEKRNAAVAQLQKQYPDYLKGLTEEQIKTGQVGDAYNQLTKGLIATAKARAASDQIAKNSLDNLTLLTQEEERAQRILEERDKLESIRGMREKATGQDLVALKTQENNQQRIVNGLIKEQLNSVGERGKLNQQDADLTTKINGLFTEGAVIQKETVKIAKAKNVEKEKEVKLEDQNILNLEFGNKLRNEALIKLGQLSSNVDRLTAKEVKIEIDGTPISAIVAGLNQIVNTTPSVAAALENLGKVKVDVSGFVPTDIKPDEVKETFSPFFEIVDELTTAFGGLGNIIGSAFGNNPKLGQFIAQFVGFAAKLIATNFKIAASNAVAGASQAAAATGPAAPFTLPAFIAASVGLIAGAFAAFGGGGKKGSAGGGGGGGMGSSGVGGGTSFTGGAQGGLFEQNRDVSGQFVVRGQDLVYVLGQANNRINKG